MSNGNRSKMDEQLEEKIEEGVKALWENKLQVFTTLVVALPIACAYLWTQQKPLLDKYLPTDEIERIAIIYFPTIIILLFFFAVLLVIRGILVAKWNRKNYVYTLVLPHSKDGVKAESLNETIRSFHGCKRSPLKRLIYGKERFNYLIHYGEKDIKFYLGAPKDRIGALKTHLSSLYSKVEYFEPKDLVFPSKKAVGGRMKTKRKKDEATLAFANYTTDKLPVIFNNMQPNTWLQVGFTPANGYKLEKKIERAQKQTKKKRDFKDRTYTDKEELRSWDHRMSGNEVAFDVTVSMATEHYPGVAVLKGIGNSVNTIMADVNELKYRRWRHAVREYPEMYPYRMEWTGKELANLVHLPNLSAEGLAANYIDDIPHNADGRELLPYNVLSNPLGVIFGYQAHPLVEDREVRVLGRYLGEHWALSGLNGSGKSTLLNMILKSFNEQFMKSKRAPGYSFLDPARDTALLMLNNLMTRELWEKQAAEREGREPSFKVDWNKVKWISFRNTDYPPALNLLYKMEGESDDLAADQIFKIIQDNFQAAPQTERLLKMAIRTLMADPGEKHTILGIRPLLFKEEFRDPIIERLAITGKHRDIVDFWENEAEKMLDTSAVSLLNRLDIFYSNPFLKRVFGQKAFNFDIRTWMDEGFIVLYDFSGMSEAEISLVGSYLTYLYYRIADTRDSESAPLLHQFCIDEAHKVKASILPYIVREQRKKGLSLGAITQNLTDLDDELFTALTEVTGNLFVCRQGAKNARLAASAFTKDVNGKQKIVYNESYLANLPKRTAVIKITDNVDGVEKTCQTVVTVPPLDRYMPSGEVATFGDNEKAAISNRWTLAKAKELQSRDGAHYEAIDKEIEIYLYGEDTKAEIKPVSKPVKKKESLVDALLEKDAKVNEEKPADDLPLEVEAKPAEPEQIPEPEKEALQQALKEELAQNLTAAGLDEEEAEEVAEEQSLQRPRRRRSFTDSL
ncbi:hypothetical protein ABIC37_005413 [Priestia megaterium]|uniref:hypothetical protein n=1 Tax=Priestia megaterium TaxID=1404 RepID=UPI00339B5CA9